MVVKDRIAAAHGSFSRIRPLAPMCIAFNSRFLVPRQQHFYLFIRFCISLYLSDVGPRPLRSNSNDMRKLLVPRTHNKLGDRSFSAAGPRLWNDLPPGLRQPGLTFDSFRQSLKTHLFGDRSAIVTLLNV